MQTAFVFILSLLSGAAASMGLGGGTFLILYLTIFAGMNQTAAQGINLVFFIPSAAAALYFHTKNKLVNWKKIAPAVIAGTICAVIFSYIANIAEPDIIRRLFGAFVTITGMKTLSEAVKKR